MIGVVVACFACGTAGSCSSASNNSTGPQQTAATPDAPPATPERAEFDLFVFGRTLGTIAPCGCTTEPLGGLQYAFGFVDRESNANARLVVEPGSFLFPDPDGPNWPRSAAEWGQAAKRAKALHGSFSALGQSLVSAIGPTDAASPEGLAALGAYELPRVVANVTGEGLPQLPKYRAVKLVDQGVELSVGVTAVVDPTVPGAEKLGRIGEPIAAVNEAVKAMRADGVNTTIVLAQGMRAFAERIAHDAVGADIVVVGHAHGLERQRLGKPMTRAGDTFIVEPGEELQTVTHITLTVDSSPGKAVPTVSDWVITPSAAQRAEELARLDAQIAELSANPEAEPSFIQRLQAERERVKQQIDAPTTGPAIATFEQAKITCKLPVDSTAKDELVAYNAWVAEGNKKRFAGIKAPPAPKGGASYVGIDECDACHDEAVEFWEQTPHGSAYQTLVDTNQQFDLSCVSCHVTGFREPGGSEVVENAGLIDVQCEVCHGPGSLHVDEPDKDGKALNIRHDSPETVCAGCHTPEHSDTFDYDAYLRDIVGEGHGKARREALGEGPTGSELRAAGLAKAGGACKKM